MDITHIKEGSAHVLLDDILVVKRVKYEKRHTKQCTILPKFQETGYKANEKSQILHQ